MKERALDEFGSLFQRAIIPTIEVEEIEITDIVVLSDGSPRVAAAGTVAEGLATRFGATTSVRELPHGEDALKHIAEITENEKPSLIVSPAPLHLDDDPKEDQALGAVIDALLVRTAIPTLLLRRDEGLDDLFTKILVNIPGGRHDLIEQFSFAFALCAPGGLIRLLHIVEQERLDELAELLQVTPDIDTKEGAADLLDAVERRMDHLLRGAIRTAEGAAFKVEADIEVGDPFALVPAMAKDFSLLIVGSQKDHAEFLDSRAYALMQKIPGVPVLAL